MNTTATQCRLLAVLVKRRPKQLIKLAFNDNADKFPHFTCTHLNFKNLRNLHTPTWSTFKQRQPTSSYFCSRLPATAAFSSQENKLHGKKDDVASSHHGNQPPELTVDEEMKKLGLFARFKKMYKEYWYVLIPAHVVTSVIWYGSFYYLSTSGVDIVALLEKWNFHEMMIKPFRDSSLGHFAVAYLLYKAATPARYAVTLGTTTVSIKYLVLWGIIKPVPTRTELMQMYQDKKENIQTRVEDIQAKVADRKAEIKENLEEKKQFLKDKKQSLIDDYKQLKDDYNQFKEEFKTGFQSNSPSQTTGKSTTNRGTDKKEAVREEKRQQG